MTLAIGFFSAHTARLMLRQSVFKLVSTGFFLPQESPARRQYKVHFFFEMRAKAVSKICKVAI